jgi:hypothetical protein
VKRTAIHSKEGSQVYKPRLSYFNCCTVPQRGERPDFFWNIQRYIHKIQNKAKYKEHWETFRMAGHDSPQINKKKYKHISQQLEQGMRNEGARLIFFYRETIPNSVCLLNYFQFFTIHERLYILPLVLVLQEHVHTILQISNHSYTTDYDCT